MKTIEKIDNMIKDLNEIKKDVCSHDRIVMVEINTESYFSNKDDDVFEKYRICVDCKKRIN